MGSQGVGPLERRRRGRHKALSYSEKNRKNSDFKSNFTFATYTTYFIFLHSTSRPYCCLEITLDSSNSSNDTPGRRQHATVIYTKAYYETHLIRYGIYNYSADFHALRCMLTCALLCAGRPRTVSCQVIYILRLVE